MLTEVAEIAEARNYELADWVRNHPGTEKTDVNEEISDVLFMLICLANVRGIDPVEEMIKKFKSKGWQERRDLVKMEARLTDLDTFEDHTNALVENDLSLHISIDGYGNFDNQPGLDSIITIEQYQGDIQVLIWNKYDDDEPMIISLANAKIPKEEVV